MKTIFLGLAILTASTAFAAEHSFCHSRTQIVTAEGGYGIGLLNEDGYESRLVCNDGADGDYLLLAPSNEKQVIPAGKCEEYLELIGKFRIRGLPVFKITTNEGNVAEVMLTKTLCKNL